MADGGWRMADGGWCKEATGDVEKKSNDAAASRLAMDAALSGQQQA
jgi:hypothetical protein